MRPLHFTLLGDGPSDRCLQWPVLWLLRQLGRNMDEVAWADPSRVQRGGGSLHHRLKWTVVLYPCDVLLIHRDAEGATARKREEEIAASMRGQVKLPPAVCIIPVRMTEAWLLHDVAAIRRAAGNPNGRGALTLPAITKTETEPDPKGVLFQALLDATEFKGRKLEKKKKDLTAMRYRVAELIDDYGPLRLLPAFIRFEEALQGMLMQLEDALR